MVFKYPTNLSEYGGGLLGFVRYVNQELDGLFALVWIIVFGVIIFLYSNAKGVSTGRSYTIASAIALLISIFFAVLELISWKFVIMFSILFGLGVIWLWLENKIET